MKVFFKNSELVFCNYARVIDDFSSLTKYPYIYIPSKNITILGSDSNNMAKLNVESSIKRRITVESEEETYLLFTDNSLPEAPIGNPSTLTEMLSDNQVHVIPAHTKETINIPDNARFAYFKYYNGNEYTKKIIIE